MGEVDIQPSLYTVNVYAVDALAVFKYALAQGLQSVAEAYGSKCGTILERISCDMCDTVADSQLLKRRTAVEGVIADGGDVIAKGYALKTCAGGECQRSDDH